MKNKKIYLVAFIAILVVAAILITTCRKSSKRDPISPKQLTEFAMISATTSDGENFYYLDSDHLTFYQINIKDQQPNKLIGNEIYYINEVLWSKSKNKAILRVQTSADSPYVFRVNDMVNKSIYLLKDNVLDAIWDQNDNIVTLQQEGSNYQIKVLNKNDLNQSVAEIDLKNEQCDQVVELNQKNNSLLCIAYQTDVIAYLKLIDTKSNKASLIDGEYTTTKPSPDGTKTLALKNEGESTSFWEILDSQGKQKSKLAFRTNDYDINKTTWSDDGKYLAIAVRENKDQTDKIYLIDTEKGSKKLIDLKTDIPLDIKNLILTQDNKILYFTSFNLLYKINLN